jgi:hypothetical protein
MSLPIGPTRDFAHHAARATATPIDINTEAPAARTSAASDLLRYPSLAVSHRTRARAPPLPPIAGRFITTKPARHKTNLLTDCTEVLQSVGNTAQFQSFVKINNAPAHSR